MVDWKMTRLSREMVFENVPFWGIESGVLLIRLPPSLILSREDRGQTFGIQGQKYWTTGVG